MEQNQTFAPYTGPDWLPRDPGDRETGDYEEDGLLMCGVCRTPKQKRLDLPNLGRRVVRVSCLCARQQEAEARRLRKQEEFRMEMERLERTDRISDLSYKDHLFELDDEIDDSSYVICRRYADNWEQMRKNNMGMLLYGTVGSGKTYRAGCIINNLYARQVTGTVTSFPRLLNLLQDCRDRQGLLDSLNRYECLVIDDLGAERDSPYALEQVYNIIDSRGKSGKPLIVTTNLSLQELKNPENLAYARIYDRILALCPITLKMTGGSRRQVQARKKRELAKTILGVSS